MKCGGGGAFSGYDSWGLSRPRFGAVSLCPLGASGGRPACPKRPAVGVGSTGGDPCVPLPDSTAPASNLKAEGLRGVKILQYKYRPLPIVF